MTAPFKWPRKLTKAKLAERKLYNGHDMLRSGEPAIYYQPSGDSRSMRVAGWRVFVRDRKIPDTPWYDHGTKAFIVFQDTKEVALSKAMTWATQRYGVREWVRTPFGSYVPREVAERVAGGDK